MGARSFHDDIKCSRAISPAAATTDNTAWTSQIVDTANFAATELVMQLGALADADATFTLLVENGDNSALTDNAAVADSELVGTEAAGNGSFTFADDNETIKIGYIGAKRYVRATVTPANNTGNAFLAAVWVQHGARRQQTSQQV